MAGQTAGLRIQRRRVEHIQQLMAEIADRERIAVHLVSTTFRAGYYFLTLALLTAGVIGLADGRQYLVATWGAAGVVLALLWVLARVGERVGRRVVRELGEELAKVRPHEPPDAEPGTGPAVDSPAAAGSGASPRRLAHHRIRPL